MSKAALTGSSWKRPSTFPRGDGRPFFEAKYLAPRTAARWVDTPGNSLRLCPTCTAKLMYAAVDGEDVIEQLEGLVGSAGELPEGGSVHFRLCGEPVELHFAQRHLIDLCALLEDGESDENAEL